MLSATATLELSHAIGAVRPELFGAFVEHMGRGVYGGLYEPAHPTADADGFRTDVLALVAELGVTQVRYPGGNFVSGYRWEDGVGPREQRPTRLDLAWHSRESNAFGLGEFMRWTRAAGVAPMLTLNLGTRGLSEALDLLEYANHPAGTELADRRVRHGDAEPYGIRSWCLGNELDGAWQLGHKTAAEYARLAAETARAMRQFDPSLRLIVAGSSATTMPTFGSWERVVLESCWELVDEISVHAYFEEGEDLGSFLASGVAMDAHLEAVARIADEVVAAAGGSKRIGLAVDEWNVWYMRRHQERFHPQRWLEAPVLCEDAYSAADAVVVGGLLISFLRHADRVSSACLAQLVNTIAPIKTSPAGPVWRETTFHPFAITAGHARGTAVRLLFEAPTMATTDHGAVPVVDGVATTADDGTGSLFLVNRHPSEAVALAVHLDPAWPVTVGEAQRIGDPDPHAANHASHTDRVRPQPATVRRRGEHALLVELPPACWAHVGLRAGPDSRAGLR